MRRRVCGGQFNEIRPEFLHEIRKNAFYRRATMKLPVNEIDTFHGTVIDCQLVPQCAKSVGRYLLSALRRHDQFDDLS